jgi:DNA-binding transcriptional ArsR family regulator
MVKNPEVMARIFQALSTPTRVRLLCLLKDQPVSEIARQLEVTQGAVSQHLRILRDADLVQAERHGYQVHYHVLASALDQCRQALECILQCPVMQSTDNGRAASCAKSQAAKRSRG